MLHPSRDRCAHGSPRPSPGSQKRQQKPPRSGHERVNVLMQKRNRSLKHQPSRFPEQAEAARQKRREASFCRNRMRRRQASVHCASCANSQSAIPGPPHSGAPGFLRLASWLAGNRTAAAANSGASSPHALPSTADGADYSLEGNAVAGVRAQTLGMPEKSNAMAKPITPSLNVCIPTIPPIGCGTGTNRPGHHDVRG